jgi:phosphoribosylformylglycinamidine cyclo-ligase
MRAAVRRTHAGVAGTWPVVEGAGGFAGLVDASALLGMRRPLLATSTDGVGTKVAVAQAMDLHGTVGIDLVAMVVDDLVACGARPLFMSDYVACGSVVPERVAAIVGGVAAGCETARCALVAGETAEHPGLLGPDEYDLAGAATGVVEADDLLGPHRVGTGDVLVAMAASGPARQRLLPGARRRRPAGLGVGPPRGRARPDRRRGAAGADHGVRRRRRRPARRPAGGGRAITHVTGGGLAANLARVLPVGAHADVDRSTWAVPAVVRVLGDGRGRAGHRPRAHVEHGRRDGRRRLRGPRRRVVSALCAAGTRAWVCGEVGSADPDAPVGAGTARGTKGVAGGSARLVGTYQT